MLLDDAVAARGFQVRTQFIGLFRGDERTHHGAVIDALCTEISAAHHQLMPAEQLGIFGLQRTEGRLHFVFVTL